MRFPWQLLGITAAVLSIVFVIDKQVSFNPEDRLDVSSSFKSETKTAKAKIHGNTELKPPILWTSSSAVAEHVRSNATLPLLNEEVDGEDGRPLVVLHIGPHKTASSTIQCEFTHHYEVLYKEASFAYIGRQYPECQQKRSTRTRYQVDTRQLVSCLNRHDADNRPCDKRSEWKDFETLLEALARKKKNVIISDEVFARMTTSSESMELLKETLSRRFRVKVVVVYRRYYEWLFSMYNEKYKPLGRRSRYQEWPGSHHGIEMRTFVDYYRRSLQYEGFGGYQLKAEKANLHPAEWLRQLWTLYFSHVVIFNMHQAGETLVTNFMHQVLPGTEDAIKYIRQHKAPYKVNPSVCLDYDILGVAAYRQGLVRKKLKRRQVSFAVEKLFKTFQTKHNKTISLPMVCLLQNEKDTLLNRSLALERTVLHDIGDKEQHTLAFAEARNKFCNVDTKEVLANKAWQKFFSSL